jgi:hypothetical protein
MLGYLTFGLGGRQQDRHIFRWLEFRVCLVNGVIPEKIETKKKKKEEVWL